MAATALDNQEALLAHFNLLIKLGSQWSQKSSIGLYELTHIYATRNLRNFLVAGECASTHGSKSWRQSTSRRCCEFLLVRGKGVMQDTNMSATNEVVNVSALMYLWPGETGVELQARLRRETGKYFDILSNWIFSPETCPRWALHIHLHHPWTHNKLMQDLRLENRSSQIQQATPRYLYSVDG